LTRVAREPGGRVHLTVHRDPASGAESVALTVPVFEQDWQNEIAAAAANTVHGTFAGAPSLEGAVVIARDSMTAAERLIGVLLARAPAGAVACKAGCDHCCYQSVGVTPPEVLAIFDHLSRTLSDDALERFAAHVAEARARTRGLSSAERFSPEQPCVFLAAGHCTIYDIRPLACRGMNALDAGACEKRLRDPETRAAFLAGGRGGESFMEPIRAFHAVSAGLQIGAAELYGLDMRPLDLIGALDLLFHGPEEIPDAWIAGGSSFAPARGGDGSDAPALGPLSGRIASDPSTPRR
jgi:Fe-S-cluster containining protein